MRSKLIIAALLVAFVATGAMAGQIKTEKGVAEFHGIVGGPAFDSRTLFQGFEEDFFPPTGWSVTTSGSNAQWLSLETDTVEGLRSAYIAWSTDIAQNDVFFIDYDIDVAGGDYVLSFWTAGDFDNGYADLATETVEINGVTVWDFDSVSSVSYTFEKYFIDLSAYDGQTVTIGFRIVGYDANSHYFDAIMVDDGTGYDPPPPPDPPENDTCADVIDLQVQSLPSFQVDLCQATNVFSPVPDAGTSCTGFSAAGSDVVYSIYLTAGDNFFVTEDGTHDMSMYLVTDCADPGNTCVAGSDNCCSGAQEVIDYPVTADGVYYLIVDGYTGCGLVTVTVDTPVGTGNASWGSVKALYR